jgi:CheY-like chemotaxis protein
MPVIENSRSQALQQVRSEIPFLRRFGRALTGFQSMADTAVVQLMNDLLFDASFLDASDSPRVALYRRLLSLLETLAANTFEPSASAPTDTALATSRARQGYLLTTIEGFSNAAAAEVLSISQAEFGVMLAAAKEEISQQPSSNVLIIEDEVFIALDLEALVCGLGHKVTASARTHKEAIAAVERKRPDLIISDVQLADGSSGIEAVDEILSSSDISAVFITAYPERLLTGKRGEPAFLIAKPFDTAAVRATISQALYLSQLRART